ncbi:hypothetical protein C4553_01200 [Candidatus Parcubacteria bacterium]|nr:MAG: hypothetical protein C4553_01200 [Candidatus Parcubacteria bacterium]
MYILRLIWLVFLGVLIFHGIMSWVLLYHINKYRLKDDSHYSWLSGIFIFGSVTLILSGLLSLLLATSQ